MSNEIIYLVRHGQTEWNREGIIQGHLDSLLTEKGRRQVESIGQHFLKILPNTIDVHIESSHLGRAKASAAIISEMIGLDHKQMSTTELLAELHQGVWQGLHKTQIEARWPGLLSEWEQNKWNFQIPGGENYQMLSKRARTWLDLKRKAPITIVITHQQFSNSLRGQYANLSPEDTLKLAHEQYCFFGLHDGNVEKHTVKPLLYSHFKKI